MNKYKHFINKFKQHDSKLMECIELAYNLIFESTETQIDKTKETLDMLDNKNDAKDDNIDQNLDDNLDDEIISKITNANK